ncbi:alpha/beta fold hydrolase [Tateyamaria omphalii]|uniref:alpha/beta fold hydrolase n=1 Tax=Tateyamaria omphalii TaxID=299262 RepID=UPI00167810CB|nr:alpha/beta fold hydrolase [Tateyamaria omphalii]
MKNKTEPALDLVAIAYKVAIDPSRFEELLTSWDQWVGTRPSGEGEFSELLPDFLSAIDASERLSEAKQVPTALERVPSPAVLMDTSGRVLATNAAAELLLAEDVLDTDAFFAQSRRSAVGFSDSAQKLFRLGGGPSRRSFLALEIPATAAIAENYPGAHSMLLVSLMDWNEEFESELVERLALSTAEIKVARALLEGRTAQEAASDLGRSLATIRSHIKTLLIKTGARRQTELVQFLTILRQVSSVVHRAERQVVGAQGVQSTLLANRGAVLEVTDYGQGRPLLYFTTSSLPWETSAVRAAFADAGFRVIAPCRPGFGRSTREDGDASDALMQIWLDQLLDLAGDKPLIAGHREGGILAARVAAASLNAGHDIAGLALISTGAPVRDVAQLDNAPPSVRRSFLAAHFARAALKLGYSAAARLFQSGRKGQETLVRFFCHECPRDMALIEQSDYFEIVRGNLSFCFEHTYQIVRDLEKWGRDWSHDLELVGAQAPVLFVQGMKHHFLPMENVARLCEQHKTMRYVELPISGQLALYEFPKEVAEACRSFTN